MPTMLAAVLHDFNDVRLEEIAIPVPEAPDEVVVRIKACGFCQTDHKAIRGVRRNVSFPFIAGHEASGVVSAVGSAVRHFREGDEVILQPSGYCGFCSHCRDGNNHYCATAFTTGGDGPEDVWPGSFAEYTRTRESCLFHKPASVSFAAAALTEPLSGAWKGIIDHSGMQLGDDVVVIGVGSIGLLCMMVARAAGAGRLIAIDTSPFARETALRLGASHVIDPAEGGVRDKVYAIMPDGPDLVVEAAGPIQAVQQMLELRRRGTRWNIFGITTHETFTLDGGLEHFLEARMDASFGTHPRAMQQAIRLMERGSLDPAESISHRFTLEQFNDALAVLDTPKHNKVIVAP